MKEPHHSLTSSGYTQRNICSFLCLVLCLSILASCQATQSAFSRTTGDAGSTFAAAATVLDYTHQGKFSQAYATATFEGFSSQLNGLDQQLPSLKGIPNTQVLHSLLHAYQSAITVVNKPCLENTCDWHTQLTKLKTASSVFLKAGGQ